MPAAFLLLRSLLVLTSLWPLADEQLLLQPQQCILYIYTTVIEPSQGCVVQSSYDCARRAIPQWVVTPYKSIFERR
jgi:hypothetical protein